MEEGGIEEDGSAKEASRAEEDSMVEDGKMRKDIKKIDLHMHSNISDGTDTPEELVRKVAESGIDLFSLTDHDSIKGAVIISAILKGMDGQPRDASHPTQDASCPTQDASSPTQDASSPTQDASSPMFVSGVEFSCRDSLGKYHLLGYGYDPANERIAGLADKVHGFRMRKAKDRLDYLDMHYGIRFPDEAVRAYFSMDNPGKPQLGNLLVDYGHAPDRDTAIERYINRMKLKSSYIGPEEAIDSILAAGGVPVLAHPAFGSGSEYITGADMEDRLLRLIDMGLQGVEAYYSRFTPGIQSEQLHFADKYGLYVTAGSDYHGMNKPVRLGENNLEDARTGAPGLSSFLTRVLA